MPGAEHEFAVAAVRLGGKSRNATVRGHAPIEPARSNERTTARGGRATARSGRSATPDDAA